MMSLLSLIMKPSAHATLSFAEPVCLSCLCCTQPCSCPAWEQGYAILHRGVEILCINI